MARITTEAGERRREEILSGALRCFARRGVSATTIEDIRAESGASVGSIYHHVGGKDDIVASLYAEAVSAYRNGIMTALRSQYDPRVSLVAAVQFHVGWMASHRELARLMLRWDETELSESGRARLKKEARSFAKEMGEWLQDGVRAGQIRAMAPELHGAILMGPLLEYGRRQVRSMTSQPVEITAPVLAESIWRALSAAERSPVG